ncbi:MAG: type II toxin-antitoxin system HicB family antitoxin [Janthinobacterium lividum]
MKYPLYVKHNADGSFSAKLPDFPEVHPLGETLALLAHNAQAAVEKVYDGSDDLIPEPTSDTAELRKLDIDDGEGIWMFIDINLARVESNSIGFHISLLKTLLHEIDAAAKARELTRSAFIAAALEHELKRLT